MILVVWFALHALLIFLKNLKKLLCITKFEDWKKYHYIMFCYALQAYLYLIDGRGQRFLNEAGIDIRDKSVSSYDFQNLTVLVLKVYLSSLF